VKRDGRDKYTTGGDKWLSTYVECVSNADFKVAFSIKPPFKIDGDSLAFSVKIDGQPIAKTWFPDTAGPVQSETLAATFERVSSHKVIRKALKFTSLQKGTFVARRRCLAHPSALQQMNPIIPINAR